MADIGLCNMGAKSAHWRTEEIKKEAKMIPAIGIMIAFYIIIRMLNLIIEKRKEPGFSTMFFAILTILVTIYAIYALITGSTEASELLK